VNVTPNPDEDPRCECGARLTEQERRGRRSTGLCRKCRARARWQRREQARHRATEGRKRPFGTVREIRKG